MGESECNRYANRHDIGRRLVYHVTWSLVNTDEGKTKYERIDIRATARSSRNEVEIFSLQNCWPQCATYVAKRRQSTVALKNAARLAIVRELKTSKIFLFTRFLFFTDGNVLQDAHGQLASTYAVFFKAYSSVLISVLTLRTG